MQDIFYYSNVENKEIKLSTGLYGISNNLLDTPWYKVLKAKELFNNKIDELVTCSQPDQIRDLLFPILEDKTFAPNNLLPQTGISIELEKLLSPIFVYLPSHQYGTRSSTILLFEKENILFQKKYLRTVRKCLYRLLTY